MNAPRRWIWMAAFLCLFAAGCAGLKPRPMGLTVAITPDTIHPGDVVSVRVDAPEGSRGLRGRLDVSGSPVLPLKTRDQGKTWTFATQIPIDAVWRPGRYKVEIRGEGPGGETLYGETWINAP